MSQQSRRFLAVILSVSVFLRIAASFYLGNEVIALPGTFDQVSYHNLALRVLGGYGFTFDKNWWPMTAAGSPTAHWSYLYTLYLVAVYWLFGPRALVARLIQAVIVGLLQPYLAYRIGQRMFGDTVGLLSAAITALYSYFIYYAATLMTEPFYITAILAAFYLAMRLADEERSKKQLRLGAGLGITLAIIVLLRQLFLLFVPFLFAWLWWAHYRARKAWPLLPTLLAGGIMIAAILPVTYFNYTQFNRFVLLNTNAGYAFYFGNHPSYGTRFIPARDMRDYQSLVPPELRQLDEAALDNALLKLSFEFIRDDPVRYLLLSINRIPEFFRFWPSRQSGLISNVARVSSFGLALPFMLLGILFWLRAQRKHGLAACFQTPGALLLLFGVVYTGIHVLTWTLVRYRLPVDAVLVLFAGFALQELYRRWTARQTPLMDKNAAG